MTMRKKPEPGRARMLLVMDDSRTSLALSMIMVFVGYTTDADFARIMSVHAMLAVTAAVWLGMTIALGTGR